MTLAVNNRRKESAYWLCEMTSLAPTSLSVAVPTGQLWGPGPGIEVKPISKASPPSKEESKRLLQLKELARRFSGVEYYEPGPGSAMVRYQLRLLPQPIYRFADPGAGLMDGAIFLLAYGRNPELAIVIEARAEGTSTHWVYGINRISAAKSEVELDGAPVWEAPRVYRHGPNDPYWVFVQPAVPDE
jgi:hypothetical protein